MSSALSELEQHAHRIRRLALRMGEVQGPGTVRVGVKAVLRCGWDRYLRADGAVVGMRGVGASGPADALYQHVGITADNIVAHARHCLESQAHAPD